MVDDANDPIARSTVALVRNDELSTGRTHCSGTLIEPGIILTAAHCFLNVNRTDISFVFSNRVSSATPEKIRRLKRLLRHEGFDANAGRQNLPQPAADIALATFDGDIPAGFQTVRIGTLLNPPPASLDIAGFGQQENASPSTSGVLKTISAYISGVDAVRKSIEFQSTSENPTGGMPGDSGGPAYLRNGENLYVVGVLSTQGVSDSNQAFNGHNSYTSLSFYESWIRSGITKIMNPDFIPDPPAKFKYLVGKFDSATYSLGITNIDPEYHACVFHMSASPISTPQTSVPLELKSSPYANQLSSSIEIHLAGNASGNSENFKNIFAMRHEAGKPMQNFRVSAQCDGYPPSSPQEPRLTSEIETEITTPH